MTDRLVVDTDVVSFVFKGDSRAKLYEPHLNGRQLVVSFMTVAELYRWTEERNWGAKQIAALEAHLRKFVVHPVDPNLCKIWGRIMAEGKKNGKVIACADAWIAATALANAIPLVSHNGKHYSGVAGLSIVCGPEP